MFRERFGFSAQLVFLSPAHIFDFADERFTNLKMSGNVLEFSAFLVPKHDKLFLRDRFTSFQRPVAL